MESRQRPPQNRAGGGERVTSRRNKGRTREGVEAVGGAQPKWVAESARESATWRTAALASKDVASFVRMTRGSPDPY